MISEHLPSSVRRQLVAAAAAAAQARINAGRNGALSDAYLAKIEEIDRIRSAAAKMLPRMFR